MFSLVLLLLLTYLKKTWVFFCYTPHYWLDMVLQEAQCKHEFHFLSSSKLQRRINVASCRRISSFLLGLGEGYGISIPSLTQQQFALAKGVITTATYPLHAPE